MIHIASYEIVRTSQYPRGNPPEHSRIVEVEVAGGERFKVAPVVAWIDRNEHQFWVRDPDTRKLVQVETYYDTNLSRRHIRTRPNSTTKDNLDSLPTY